MLAHAANGMQDLAQVPKRLCFIGQWLRNWSRHAPSRSVHTDGCMLLVRMQAKGCLLLLTWRGGVFLIRFFFFEFQARTFQIVGEDCCYSSHGSLDDWRIWNRNRRRDKRPYIALFSTFLLHIGVCLHGSSFIAFNAWNVQAGTLRSRNQ